MRKVLRYATTAIGAILVCVAYLTTETVVDEMGYTHWVRSLAKNGWAVIVDSGYSVWVIWSAIFFCGGAAALWIDYFLRPKKTVGEIKEKIEKTVTGKLFQNAEVVLDGTAYTHCKFKNVTFVYDGGKFELSHNEIAGCNVRTNVLQIESYVRFLLDLGFLRVPAYDDSGPVKSSGFETRGSASQSENSSNG